jgi:hypothetical protein
MGAGYSGKWNAVSGLFIENKKLKKDLTSLKSLINFFNS